MPKRIAFIIPPLIEKVWTFAGDQLYLGAACIAAGLLADGHYVRAIDCAVECRSRAELERQLRECKPDIAAIPAIFGTVENAYRIARAVKESCGARVVLGGLPATFAYERILAESPEVDVCVVGEGETTMRELAGGGDLGEIAGLAFRDGGQLRRTSDRPLVQDLDSQPFPALQLFPMRRYRAMSLMTSSSKISTNLETKRGCAYSCEFCVQAPKEGKSYRLRSVESVLDEMERLRVEYPFIRRIMIVDNDFLAPYAHGVGIIEGLLSRGLQEQFEFMIATRVQNFLRDEERLTTLCDRANIRLVYFGVESVNEKNRARLNKVKADTDLRGLFERMRKKEVHSVGSYIFGFGNEERSDILETVSASRHDLPSFVKYNILTPYPGTKVWEEYDKLGLLLAERPLTEYDNAHQVVRHPVDGQAMLHWAYRWFHFSPAFIGLIEWLTLFRRKKGLRLMVFIHHVLRRELFGPARDAYRYVKYTLMGSDDLIG